MNLLQNNHLPEGLHPMVSLAPYTWLHVGGVISWFYTPPSYEYLKKVLKENILEKPFRILGAGSNLLICDGRLDGTCIRLSHQSFQTIEEETLKSDDSDNMIVRVGAGTLNSEFSHKAAKEGWKGFEFLISIPGTLGGSVRMNAGCYGKELSQILISITACDIYGEIHELSQKDLEMCYRKTSGLPQDWIVLDVLLKGKKGIPEEILSQNNFYMQERRRTQPVFEHTAGSIFKNPPGYSAWKLIEAVGMRGASRGDAQISPLHANFFINLGNASADDLKYLGEDIRYKVKNKFGIELEWEIHQWI